jgi:hypothetical protein
LPPSALPLNRTSVFLHRRLRIENTGGLGSGWRRGGGRAWALRSTFVLVLFGLSAASLLLSCPARPVWTNAVADGLIAISYALLFGCLFWLAGKVRHSTVLHPYLWIFIGFGSFILACGVTHGMEIVTIWWPVYPLAAAFKVVCAAISVSTAVLFVKATPTLAASILAVIDSLAQERQETENEAVNYQGRSKRSTELR